MFSVRRAIPLALPCFPHTHSTETDRILSIIAPSPGPRDYKSLFADTEDSFGKVVMYNDPESLGRVKTRDTKDRRASWEELLEAPPQTDIGILVALSFFGGMLSPSNTSRFTRVTSESLKDSQEWLGLANMVGLLNSVIDNTGDSDQSEARDALRYFNLIVGSAFS